jgi:hypothetical protein
MIWGIIFSVVRIQRDLILKKNVGLQQAWNGALTTLEGVVEKGLENTIQAVESCYENADLSVTHPRPERVPLLDWPPVRSNVVDNEDDDQEDNDPVSGETFSVG